MMDHPDQTVRWRLFTNAGGIAANNIAKWDGSSWSSLGLGVNSWINALTVFDDGSSSGPGLYAGGSFTNAGGIAANNIAKWDGSSWSPLGSGIGGLFAEVYSLAAFDDVQEGSPALYAGGYFETAGGSYASNIARWGSCPATSLPCPCDTDSDGVQTISDYFAYLTNFFSQLGGPGSADLDQDGTVTIGDYFNFLNCLPAIAASEVCP